MFGDPGLHVGAKLALSWRIWAQELALDGLVGLREASRIIFLRKQNSDGFVVVFFVISARPVPWVRVRNCQAVAEVSVCIKIV